MAPEYMWLTHISFFVDITSPRGFALPDHPELLETRASRPPWDTICPCVLAGSPFSELDQAGGCSGQEKFRRKIYLNSPCVQVSPSL